tara:strand:- start:14 stop:166 length:153 start_codon:yes stop_codon:yes gene_type:complete
MFGKINIINADEGLKGLLGETGAATSITGECNGPAAQIVREQCPTSCNNK